MYYNFRKNTHRQDAVGELKLHSVTSEQTVPFTTLHVNKTWVTTCSLLGQLFTALGSLVCRVVTQFPAEQQHMQLHLVPNVMESTQHGMHHP